MRNYKLNFENFFAGSGLDLAGTGLMKNLIKADFKKLFERGIEILYKQSHLKELMHGGELELTLVDDSTIQLTNRDYRGIDKPTDVVSLSYFEPEFLAKDAPGHIFGTHNLLGEIFISVDTAARQAKEHKKTLKQELQFLFAHGLLHVFGYDHEKAEERKIMFNLQNEILSD